jgi:hypothetical protein
MSVDLPSAPIFRPGGSVAFPFVARVRTISARFGSICRPGTSPLFRSLCDLTFHTTAITVTANNSDYCRTDSAGGASDSRCSEAINGVRTRVFLHWNRAIDRT